MTTATPEMSTTVQSEEATWRDPKRYAWLLGLLVPLSPFIAYAASAVTGWSAVWYLGPLIVFVLFPLLDLVVGTDSHNPPDSVLKWLAAGRSYRRLPSALSP